ncbi:hypothetical protein lerEdw1_007008 [Lerista edwardsae]|nr:hypothetical protein lerEdw1_007008 [Lerista edwardsae]
MSHKGCLRVTKYFLFIFNLLFFILGSLLFSFGLWILFDRNSFATVLGSTYYGLKVWSYIFCGVGILTMLMGFLGCLGSLKEVKCMLGFYFAFLLLLFIAQITIGILIYTQRNTIGEKVGEYVKGLIENYGKMGTVSDHDESWNFVQEQFHCCGWTSSEDWKNNEVTRNFTSTIYPCSCFNSSSSGQPESNHTMTLPTGFCADQELGPAHKEGCKNNVEVWLTSNIISIVGICLGIALMEFLQLLCRVLTNVLERRDLHSGGSQEILYFPNRWHLGLCLMMLSMFLCRTVGPDYDKLTRYSR